MPTPAEVRASISAATGLWVDADNELDLAMRALARSKAALQHVLLEPEPLLAEYSQLANLGVALLTRVGDLGQELDLTLRAMASTAAAAALTPVAAMPWDESGAMRELAEQTKALELHTHALQMKNVLLCAKEFRKLAETGLAVSEKPELVEIGTIVGEAAIDLLEKAFHLDTAKAVYDLVTRLYRLSDAYKMNTAGLVQSTRWVLQIDSWARNAAAWINKMAEFLTIVKGQAGMQLQR